MTRAMPIICVVLCAVGACAPADETATTADAVAPVSVHVIEPGVVLRPMPAVTAEQAITRSVLLACEGNMLVRVDEADGESVQTRLRRRSNNPYALAVNTGDVPRADAAVVEGGRVLLKASGSGSSEVHLAQSDD